MQFDFRSPKLISIIKILIGIFHFLSIAWWVSFFHFLISLRFLFFSLGLRLHDQVRLECKRGLVVLGYSLQVILNLCRERGSVRSFAVGGGILRWAFVCLCLRQSYQVAQESLLVLFVVDVVHNDDVSSERVVEAKLLDFLEVLSAISWRSQTWLHWNVVCVS